MDRTHIIQGSHAPEKRELAYRMRQEMTPTEALLWERLRAGRLGGLHFRRQQVIDGLIVDFYCHALGLVVEVDGAVHEGRREQDADRDTILKARGLHVLRFTNDQVEMHISYVLTEIAKQRPADR